MNSHEVFIHIHQGCFAGTGAIVRLPQCQWSKPDGYGKISQCITTTKHSKAKTVCIFLGIYCMSCVLFDWMVTEVPILWVIHHLTYIRQFPRPISAQYLLDFYWISLFILFEVSSWISLTRIIEYCSRHIIALQTCIPVSNRRIILVVTWVCIWAVYHKYIRTFWQLAVCLNIYLKFTVFLNVGLIIVYGYILTQHNECIIQRLLSTNCISFESPEVSQYLSYSDWKCHIGCSTCAHLFKPSAPNGLAKKSYDCYPLDDRKWQVTQYRSI